MMDRRVVWEDNHFPLSPCGLNYIILPPLPSPPSRKSWHWRWLHLVLTTKVFRTRALSPEPSKNSQRENSRARTTEPLFSEKPAPCPLSCMKRDSKYLQSRHTIRSSKYFNIISDRHNQSAFLLNSIFLGSFHEIVTISMPPVDKAWMISIIEPDRLCFVPLCKQYFIFNNRNHDKKAFRKLWIIYVHVDGSK